MTADTATPEYCDECGEELGRSRYLLSGKPGVFHFRCLQRRIVREARELRVVRTDTAGNPES